VVVVTDPGISKTQLSQTLRRGTFGDEVKAVQQRLKEFGFDPGPVDGVFGGGTEQAVWAFEGLVLKRANTEQSGEVTNDTWQLMQDPITFGPRRQQGVGRTHMEIYLDLQAAIVFTDDRPTLITHISSGTGERWCALVTQDTDNKGQPLPEPIKVDQCGISKTPGGVFHFTHRYPGNRQGPLGGMWNPVYFNYGIAVHGAKNVPTEPASHGCIRIPMFIADYFPSLVKNKDLVFVWDGKKEPEQQSKTDMLPVFNFPNPDATPPPRVPPRHPPRSRRPPPLRSRRPQLRPPPPRWPRPPRWHPPRAPLAADRPRSSSSASRRVSRFGRRRGRRALRCERPRSSRRHCR
jgi:hypothetical protein